MLKLGFILSFFIVTTCFGQGGGKVSAFLSFQANKTLYDRTITNNTGGFGFGLQALVNTNTLIRPLLEINADLFAGTKERYLTGDGKPIEAKSGVLGIYVGPAFHTTQRMFIATTIGTSLYNGKSHFGVRPAIGFYPSKSKKWTAKVSFTNIFQRDATSKKSLAI